MSGLLRRLTRRRPATADETGSPAAGSSEPAAAPADTPAEAGGDRPLPAADEQATQILPATGEESAAEQTSPGAEWAKSAVKPETPATPEAEETQAEPTTDQPTAFAAQRPQGRDLPAGVDPGDLSSGPAVSARRGKLRRRLRYLRHVRELLLRDLGGFTYEIHRTAGGTAQEAHNKLTAAKAGRIAALDSEVAAIEARLGEPHPAPVLREAGIGGTCPECGELHASDAHYCSRCGAPLDEKARAERQVAAAAAAAPETASHPTPEPQPASVLWAGGPRPSAGAEAEERPSPTTGQWLAAQPTTLDREAKPGEGAAADDVAKADEPAADESVVAAGESAPKAEPTGDEPAPNVDQPVVADDESAPKVEAAGDEPPADDPSAKPKRARASRAKEPAQPAPEAGDEGSNGRRDEDVPPPVTSPDPLASQREQGE